LRRVKNNIAFYTFCHILKKGIF